MFRELWQSILLEYDALKGIQWDWQSMDGTMTKAPLGGEKIGRNPTNRGKSGVKRSVLTGGAGIPLWVVAAPANKPDFHLVRETLETIPIERSAASEESPQGMCMDKGYDYSEVEALLKEFSCTAHIRARGEERKLLKESGQRARW